MVKKVLYETKATVERRMLAYGEDYWQEFKVRRERMKRAGVQVATAWWDTAKDMDIMWDKQHPGVLPPGVPKILPFKYPGDDGLTTDERSLRVTSWNKHPPASVVNVPGESAEGAPGSRPETGAAVLPPPAGVEDRHGRVPKALFAGRESISMVKEATWVLRNLSFNDVRPGDAPGPFAWRMYWLATRGGGQEMAIIDTLLSKFGPSRQQLEKEGSDDGYVERRIGDLVSRLRDIRSPQQVAESVAAEITEGNRSAVSAVRGDSYGLGGELGVSEESDRAGADGHGATEGTATDVRGGSDVLRERVRVDGESEEREQRDHSGDNAGVPDRTFY